MTSSFSGSIQPQLADLPNSQPEVDPSLVGNDLRVGHAIRWKALRAILLIGVLILVTRESPYSKSDERQLFIAGLSYLRNQISRDTRIDRQIASIPLFRHANTHLPADVQSFLLPYEN